MNFLTKKDKSTFVFPSDLPQQLKSLEQFEPFFRDFTVITVIYLAEPRSRKMLSEELMDPQLGQSQDTAESARRRFFDDNNCIVTARIIPNDQREQDTLVLECLSTKLTQSQARNILSPLLIISSRIFVHM
jgi:hypothetical protein